MYTYCIKIPFIISLLIRMDRPEFFCRFANKFGAFRIGRPESFPSLFPINALFSVIVELRVWPLILTANTNINYW